MGAAQGAHGHSLGTEWGGRGGGLEVPCIRHLPLPDQVGGMQERIKWHQHGPQMIGVALVPVSDVDGDQGRRFAFGPDGAPLGHEVLGQARVGAGQVRDCLRTEPAVGMMEQLRGETVGKTALPPEKAFRDAVDLRDLDPLGVRVTAGGREEVAVHAEACPAVCGVGEHPPGRIVDQHSAHVESLWGRGGEGGWEARDGCSWQREYRPW